MIKPRKRQGKYTVQRELAGSIEHSAVFTASPLVRSLIHCLFGPGKRDGKIDSRADTHCSASLSDLNKAAEQPLSGRIRFLNFYCLKQNGLNQAVSIISRGTCRGHFRSFS